MKPIKKWSIVDVEHPDSIGTETQKTRPAIVVSSNEIHWKLKRATVIPMTGSLGNFYPSRMEVTIDGRTSLLMLDQIETVSLSRITRRPEILPTHYQPQILKALAEYFAAP